MKLNFVMNPMVFNNFKVLILVEKKTGDQFIESTQEKEPIIACIIYLDELLLLLILWMSIYGALLEY